MITFELIEVKADNIEPAKLVWRRYKRPTKRLVERFLDMNPDMVRNMGASPYIKLGEIVMMPIDTDQLKGKPQHQEMVTITGRK